MLPTKPTHFAGLAVLLVAVLFFLARNVQVGLIFVVLGLGLLFSRYLLKDNDKGRDDAR